MEHHKRCLENQCRVCGKKPNGYKYKKTGDSCQAVLSSVLGLESQMMSTLQQVLRNTEGAGEGKEERDNARN